MELEEDGRFAAGLAHFEAGDWLEAADAFEELWFEAVRDEVPFIRVFLQLATGLHHVSRGQRNAAIERLEEGLRAIREVTNDRGYDLAALTSSVKAAMAEIRKGGSPSVVALVRRSR
jgi:predicted metal-dependent hydrolase